MQQISFHLDIKNEYDPNEYIISQCNQLAYNALNNWQKKWGTSPYKKTLIIQGPKSSGKTFLAKKWSIASDAFFLDITTEFKQDILSKYNAFILDGLDLSCYEEKILHYFNMINEHDKYLLITGVDFSNIKLPDLDSRIKSTYRINIDMPDDEIMQMLIFKLFSNYSIVVSNDVIQYLLKHLSRQFSEIIQIVRRLHLFALQHKRKITIPLVKDVLTHC